MGPARLLEIKHNHAAAPSMAGSRRFGHPADLDATLIRHISTLYNFDIQLAMALPISFGESS
jgi:hypothetical protein